MWNQVQIYFTDSFHFSQLTPQTASFCFHNIDNNTFLIQNHILLLFELYRKHGFLSFNNFLNEISKIKNLEKRAPSNNWSKCERFRNKRHRIENKRGQGDSFFFTYFILLNRYMFMYKYIWDLYLNGYI